MVRKGVLFLLVIFCLGFVVAQSVVINSPINNSVVRTQIVTINATVNNSDYCTYEFTNDGYKNGFVSVSGSSYELIKDVDLEKDDDYVLTLTCYKGSVDVTDSVNFEVDTLPIKLLYNSPSNQTTETVYSRNVLINFLFDDVFELSYLKINGEDFTGDADTSVPKSLSLSKVFEDSVGFYTVIEKVRGGAGHFLESTFSFILDAQGTIKGYVVDTQTNEEIKNAIITVEDLDTDEIKSFKSNVDGSYALELVEGTYKITTSKDGYFGNTQNSVPVNGETDINKNITLTKQIPSNVAIESLEISNNLVDGQALDIDAILSNKVSNVISVQYSLYVDDVLEETQTTSLSANQNKTLNFEFVAEGGEHVFKIQADVSGEATLSNNFAEQEVFVKSLEESVEFGEVVIYKFSDFSVADEVNNGEKFIVSAEVKNLGLAPVYNVATKLVIKKSNSVPYFELFDELGIGVDNPKKIDLDSGSSTYVEWIVQIPDETGDFDINVLLNEISSEVEELEIEGLMCTDTDGGLNYFADGWTTLNDEIGTTFSDSCMDSGHLWEAYCSGDGFDMKTITCPCEYNMCTGCGDSDYGKDYYVQGTVVNSPNIEEDDYCGNENVLMEFWCDGNTNKLAPYECLFGCNSDAGACYKCQDEDMNETYRDGKNYYMQGTFGHPETCMDNEILEEVYCEDYNKPNEEIYYYNCSTEGKKCESGACVPI